MSLLMTNAAYRLGQTVLSGVNESSMQRNSCVQKKTSPALGHLNHLPTGTSPFAFLFKLHILFSIPRKLVSAEENFSIKLSNTAIMQLNITLLLAALLFEHAVAATLYGGSKPRVIDLMKREDFDDSKAGALYGFLVTWDDAE
jgi:hypothetical protein